MTDNGDDHGAALLAFLFALRGHRCREFTDTFHEIGLGHAEALISDAKSFAELVATIANERDAAVARAEQAEANARILAHAYQHDSRPPERVVAEALAYPVGVGREEKGDEL